MSTKKNRASSDHEFIREYLLNNISKPKKMELAKKLLVNNQRDPLFQFFYNPQTQNQSLTLEANQLLTKSSESDSQSQFSDISEVRDIRINDKEPTPIIKFQSTNQAIDNLRSR